MKTTALGLALLFAAHFQSSAQLKLELPKQVSTGNKPVYLETADLNGDELMDLIYLNKGDNTLAVKFGSSDGSFSTPSRYVVAGSPRQFVLADFNADTYLDVAITGFDQDKITLLFGSASGEFSNRVDLPGGNGPFGIAASKLNDDAFPDIAVSFQNADSVGVYYGSADGTFTDRVSYYVGSAPSRIEIDLLDADAYPDIIVASNNSGKITILAGDADQQFAVVQEITSIGVSEFILADFDNDGLKDLLAVDKAPSNIRYYKGDGNANFTMLSTYPTEAVSDLLALDFDQDEDLEFCVIEENVDRITFYENSGGTFSKKYVLATGENPKSIATTVDNIGGLPSVLVANYGDNSISIFENVESEGFKGVNVLPYPTSGPIIKADINGDGLLDLAYPKYAGRAGVLYRTKDNMFSDEFVYPVDFNPIKIIAADINGDAFLDLVTLSEDSNSFSILINNGDSTFQDRVNYTTGLGPGAIRAADFNGDGLDDLLVSNTGDNTITLFTNQGDESFLSTEETLVALPDQLFVEDLNNDGYLDIAVGRDTYGPIVTYGSASNIFDKTDNVQCENQLGTIQLFDTNGDSMKDLVIMNGGFTVIKGSENGLIEQCLQSESVNYYWDPNQIDINTDGNIDIGISVENDDFISLMISRGDGTFSETRLPGVSRRLESFTAYDLDDNGVDDLVAGNSSEILLIKNISTAVPQLQVFNDSSSIDQHLSGGESNAMGTTVLGTPLTKTFRILNTGSDILTLASVDVEGSGFTINSFPAEIEFLSEEALVVEFNPQQVGEHRALVTITSNDPDEGTFEFSVFAIAEEAEPTITSLSDLATQKVRLYPNPSTGLVKIEGLIPAKDDRLIIHDLQGKMLLETLDWSNELDLTALNKGVYVISIHTKSKSINYRFIKQ
ncbi:MAG: FG-GAP-like repeat-containing protein [Cytophagales bacterium]|nr:FG-GAP-like repeat-containing protein [Cytophagales bacterium]